MRYFSKRGNIRKRVRWNRRLSLLCTLYIARGFKKIPFTLYTYVFARKLRNGTNFIQKLTPGFKNHMRNLVNFRQAVESLKIGNSMGYFCPKIIFLQLKHYIQRIYLTLLSTTCVKIHQIPDVIFQTISHFSRYSSSVYF